MSAIDKFMTLMMDREDEESLSPIIIHGGVNYMYIKHNNLYSILLNYSVFVLIASNIRNQLPWYLMYMEVGLPYTTSIRKCLV